MEWNNFYPLRFLKNTPNLIKYILLHMLLRCASLWTKYVEICILIRLKQFLLYIYKLSVDFVKYIDTHRIEEHRNSFNFRIST